MNTHVRTAFAASIIAASVLGTYAVAVGESKKDQDRPATVMSANRGTVTKIVARWGERPRLGANEMIAKYGMPQEATSERLIWHNAGPFKRIMVMNLETPHDFPMPHVDFLEHTISYNVPQGKVGDLIEFDASSTINRTVGELSARCDLEGHNILTLNLDHDIIIGKKNVSEARKAFGDIVEQDVMGKHPPYVEELQFMPAKPSTAAFSDKPVIPGSPLRAADARQSDNDGDAEILAGAITIDLNEVLAASEAKKEKMSQSALDYAKMLHEEHGANMGKTLKLGQQIRVTPIITPSVEKMQKKGANELGTLITLDGKAFERAYLTAMIKGHANAIDMIDNQFLKRAKNASLRQHLTEMRGHIADHHKKAKALQAEMVVSSKR